MVKTYESMVGTSLRQSKEQNTMRKCSAKHYKHWLIVQDSNPPGPGSTGWS